MQREASQFRYADGFTVIAPEILPFITSQGFSTVVEFIVVCHLLFHLPNSLR
jgi:hypothetical protein